MKKKILALCLVLVLAVTAITSATLAYFTDTDAQTNVFAYGNVKIDLFEDFNTKGENLVPAVFVPASKNNADGSKDEYYTSIGYGTMLGKVEKEVYVENEGSEESYVRVHIAVPSVTNAAEKQVINISRDEHSTVNGKWNWSKAATNNSWSAQNKNRYNYNVEINGVPYNVYVATYETKLATNDVTCDAINGVYMHSTTTNEDIAALDAKYKDEYGSPIWARVYVVAEAAQADGFNLTTDENDLPVEIAGAETDGTAAFKALNTSFGDCNKDYKLNAEDFLAASEGDTFKEWKALNGTD